MRGDWSKRVTAAPVRRAEAVNHFEIFHGDRPVVAAQPFKPSEKYGAGNVGLAVRDELDDTNTIAVRLSQDEARRLGEWLLGVAKS